MPFYLDYPITPNLFPQIGETHDNYILATGGINSQRKFIYTLICNLDLRESKKTTQRHMFLRGNPIWKKNGEERENSLFVKDYS